MNKLKFKLITEEDLPKYISKYGHSYDIACSQCFNEKTDKDKLYLDFYYLDNKQKELANKSDIHREKFENNLKN